MAAEMRPQGAFSRHGRALLEIGVVSGFGILATAGFQIVASRGLGPAGFGLLASFLAIINVAAVGSAALRSAVAVIMAESGPPLQSQTHGRRWRDSSMVEALILGGLCTVALLMATPLLARSLETNIGALVLTAAAVLPYFFFARAQGLLQGAGDSRSVVLWTTGSQIVQLLLTLAALALGLAYVGILFAILITAGLGAVGAAFQARNLAIPVDRKPFSRNSTIVLLLTLTFAWLTNADVILVRAGTSEIVAGSFAAAAVLIKTTLILPTTLSLYLLPRFVNRRHDAAMTKFGVNITLGLTFLSGVAMYGIVLFAGPLLISVFFGDGYAMSADLLPQLALMWLPWAMALGLLVRITAVASKSALVVIVLVAGVQWIGSTMLLPDVSAMMLFNGTLGALTLTALFAIHVVKTRRLIKEQAG